MKSKRQKGNEFQNWIEKYLKELGYEVHNQKPVGRLIKNKKGEYIWVSSRNDLFGAFDLIAINDKEIKLISATLDTHVKKRTQQVLNFLKHIKSVPSNVSLELWIKRDKKITIKRFDFSNNDFIDYGVIMRKKFYLLKK